MGEDAVGKTEKEHVVQRLKKKKRIQNHDTKKEKGSTDSC